jgi:hypothetical protein
MDGISFETWVDLDCKENRPLNTINKQTNKNPRNSSQDTAVLRILHVHFSIYIISSTYKIWLLGQRKK